MFFLLNSASNRILLVCMRTEIIGNVFQFSEFNVYLIGKLHPISGLLSGNFLQLIILSIPFQSNEKYTFKLNF